VTITPADAVDTANDVFGRHPGKRAFHAKGTLLNGTFTATTAATTLTRAAHMRGEPIPVTVRVSNGNGNPRVPDYRPDVRGLAVKFDLPDGSQTDIVSQSLPRFPFHTPDEFVEFVRTQRQPAIAWRFPLYLVQHPGMLAPLRANLPAFKPPQSYATIPYYGVHAFKFVDSQGGSRYVRYTWRPEAGEARLGAREARARGRDYLHEEIRERLAGSPVRFTLELQLAAPGDEVDDPSSRWPDDRERLSAGTLELTAVDAAADENALVFDPARVTDGIELSDDPVLRFRPAAYSESVTRRTAA
jgi:catalase